jgi:hypothetical protein
MAEKRWILVVKIGEVVEIRGVKAGARDLTPSILLTPLTLPIPLTTSKLRQEEIRSLESEWGTNEDIHGIEAGQTG